MAPEAVTPLSLQQAPTAVVPAGDLVDVHTALQHVQQLAEFQPPKPSPVQSWLEELMRHPSVTNLQEWMNSIWRQFWDKIGELLGRIAPSLAEKLHLPPMMVKIFSWTICTLLALIAMVGLYYLLGWLKRQLAPKVRDPVIEKRFEESLLISRQHHAQEARCLAKKGQLDLAVRELYLAALCVLDETGMARFEASRTNDEYRQLLRPQAIGASAIPPFQAIAGTFEASRYGHQPLAEEDFDKSVTAFAQLDQIGSNTR